MRLEVAVDDPHSVRGRETLRGLTKHPDDLAPAAGLLSDPGVVEALPAHELHRHEHTAVLLTDVVHGDDVGVR